VRHALLYVLNNHRRHVAAGGQRLSDGYLDPYSSALAFAGWARPIIYDDTPATGPPRTWLGTTGWRKHGLLLPNELPGG
jgi:hypothetical protein